MPSQARAPSALPGVLPDLPPMAAEPRVHLTALFLAALTETFGPALQAAVVKGSAYKGGFIPGFSDFDLHAYLRSSVGPMLDHRTPSLDLALAFQAAIGQIDVKPFGPGDAQVYLIDADHYPDDWTPPLPGTYELVYGELPAGLPKPTRERLISEAQAYFPPVLRGAFALIGRLLDKRDSSLPPLVRLLGTYLKPAPYHAAILDGADPLVVWTRPLPEVLAAVEPTWDPSRRLTRYFLEAYRWTEVRQDPSRLRAMFKVGYEGLEAFGARVAARA
ncbi:MAG: hypothetical protein ACYC6V_05040 [Bacillota bacterium]